MTAVETLLKYGARVSDRDYHGFNALDWAVENGHRFDSYNIMKILV